MSRIIIRDIELLRGHDLEKCDILIDNNLISAVGSNLSAVGADIIYGNGLFACPGFTDLHAHLREPGFEAKGTIASETRAAAAGGFTTVCAMPNLRPVPDCLESLKSQLSIIERDAAIKVIPFSSISRGEKGELLSDIEVLAPLCAGFSDDGRGVQSSRLMAQAMERVHSSDSFISAHCEDELLLKPGGCVQDGDYAKRNDLACISSASEFEQIKRDIGIVRRTHCPYHVCHISTKEGIEFVRRAKLDGLPVTCEVTPHHALLCQDSIISDDGKYKMNPPLRSRFDLQAIQLALQDGTIDAIATDHAPHTMQEKSLGLAHSPFGVVGFETAFAALYTGLVVSGKLPLWRLVELMTSSPQRILGENRRLSVGFDASITLLDLNFHRIVEPSKLLSMGHSTPFAGLNLQGWPVFTIYNGKIIYRYRKTGGNS